MHFSYKETALLSLRTEVKDIEHITTSQSLTHSVHMCDVCAEFAVSEAEVIYKLSVF